MLIRRTLLAAALCLGVAPVLAQANWPSKPIRIVVPYGPGSSPDVLVRLFSDKLGKTLGQPVIVENKPGAGGNTGTDYVAKAAPDGYTFLVSTNGPLVYSTVFNPKLPYDPFKDLAPVTLAGVQPNVCAVSNDMKVDDVKGWVAAMKKDPGKYNYSSTGVGSMSHLSVEIVKLKSDSYAVHLPYASSPLAILAIMQGDVQFACVPPVAVMPQAKAGKLKAIAVTSAKRRGAAGDHQPHEEGNRGHPGRARDAAEAGRGLHGKRGLDAGRAGEVDERGARPLGARHQARGCDGELIPASRAVASASAVSMPSTPADMMPPA